MIKHVLADGRTLDRIDGFQIPYTPATEAVYRFLADFLERSGRVDGIQEEKRPVAAQEA
ncbi:MAG: hypothetical protein PHV18_04470 [Lachnospiraceae bacterium]|nr:hypothetical protein [Lachnospiraceae bacterium]